MRKFSVEVDSKKCAKCGLCVGVCPVNILLLLTEDVRQQGTCIGCMECTLACPEEAIFVKEENYGK